jgi:indole-3-glycerol phosphate synthase
LNTVTTNAPVLLIGQIKYKLTDSGLLTDVYDPVAAAVRYAKMGVEAVSLFTDETLYQGGLDDLVLVARAVNLPVISQDYILDEYQIVEARAAGASALVVSARVLDQAMLRSLMSATHRNRMTAIVEVADRDDLLYALTLSPYVIGISDMNSTNGHLDTRRLSDLRALVPPNIRVMAMHSAKSLQDVHTLVKLRMDAVLVREMILEEPDQIAELQAILNQPVSNQPMDL